MADDLDSIEATPDPLLGRFVRLVVHALKWPMRYRTMYLGTVVARRADNSVDVKLDTDVIPGIVAVSIMLGFPDSDTKAKAGSRVVLAFMNADKKSPAIVAWGPGSFDEVRIGTTNPQPVIRNLDTVTVGSASGVITLGSPASKLKAGQ